MFFLLWQLYFGHFWNYPEVKGTFKQLKEGVGSASHRRNEIAHGTIAPNVTVVGRSDTGDQMETNYGCFLVGSEYLIARNRDYKSPIDTGDSLAFIPSLYRYTANDIEAFTEKFNKLSMIVVQYITECHIDENGHLKNVLKILKERAEKGKPLSAQPP